MWQKARADQRLACIQRWQVMATYSPQPFPLHLSFPARGIAPVISSGSMRR
jgi:hypothetical protein